MRIAILADFKLDSLRCTQIIARKLCKGLVRAGHDVLPVSFRDLLLQNSPIKNKKFAQILGKNKTDESCCTLLKDYQPQVVIVLTFRNLDERTVGKLRQVLPDASFVGWYEDPLDGLDEAAVGICQQLDWFMATGCGQHLAEIAQKCNVRAAFMPNPCDPDIEKRYDISKESQCDVIFTGKLGHKKCGTDTTRSELIRLLVKRYGMRIYGALGQGSVYGIDYLKHISGARIGLSINASNDISLYHSDRFIQYLSCGTFVLAKAVPDSELLFKDGVHLRYFKTNDECMQLLDYYIEHHEERQKIADEGMNRAHSEFNCTKIARHILDLATEGTYDAPWAEIL